MKTKTIKTMKKLTLVLLCLFAFTTQAQIDTQAILKGGLETPFVGYERLTTLQRDALIIVEGTTKQIYHIETGKFEYWDGSSWVIFGNVAIPNQQIAVGTGTGIQSFSNFNFDGTDLFLDASFNVNGISEFTSDNGGNILSVIDEDIGIQTHITSDFLGDDNSIIQTNDDFTMHLIGSKPATKEIYIGVGGDEELISIGDLNTDVKIGSIPNRGGILYENGATFINDSITIAAGQVIIGDPYDLEQQNKIIINNNVAGYGSNTTVEGDFYVKPLNGADRFGVSDTGFYLGAVDEWGIDAGSTYVKIQAPNHVAVGDTEGETNEIILFVDSENALVHVNNYTNSMIETAISGFYNSVATTNWVNSKINDLTITYTFATLPTPIVGLTATITDATTLVWRGVAVGGGSETALVFYNGSNWVYH